MALETKSVMREAASGVQVTNYLSHGDYLLAIFEATKAKLQSYSYLQFAADLGFSRTNVVRLVIVGQRPLTSKAAERIAKALDIHGSDRRYWTTMVKYANARLPAERDNLFRLLMSYKTRSVPSELTPVQAEYFSEWFHPVIRELVGLQDFNGDPEWIKARLGFPLRLEQIKKSLEILVAIGVIRLDEAKGKYVRSDERITTDAEVDSMAIVRYHQKMIEIGRESITRIDEDERDIRAVTVCLPKSAIPILKGKIQEWVSDVLKLEQSDDKADGVIQVNIQMFPFTK